MGNEFIDRETVAKFKKAKRVKKEKRAKTRENKAVKSVLQVVNGDVLTKDFVLKNLPFLLFLSVVLVMYIGYGYHAQKVSKDIKSLEKEILELNAEEVTLRSDLNKVSRQKTVARKLKNKGVKESEEPLKIIAIPKDE